jgi:transcriptional regulator with XRE-family HTH domain
MRGTAMSTFSRIVRAIRPTDVFAKRKQRLLEELEDKESRDAYVSSGVDVGVAFQIRALREQREWNQTQLAGKANMQQERISALENPSHSPTLSTLKKLASAFDVALIVRFIPISELVKYELDLSSKYHLMNLPSNSAGVLSYEKDPYFAKPTCSPVSLDTKTVTSTC